MSDAAMDDVWPKIISRETIAISPWVKIVAREVAFAPSEPRQIYHAVTQLDYLAIVAVTPDGRFPIVRQYRPAVERFTWELPAGLAELGENHAEGCMRELHEETGYATQSIHHLGSAAPCTGRLSNHIHSYLLRTGERDTDFIPEPGLTVDLVTPAELVGMIASGEFTPQLHLGALLLAQLHGFIALPTVERP